MAFNKAIEKVSIHLQMARNQESEKNNNIIGNARVVEYLLNHLDVSGVGKLFQFLDKLKHKCL
jgi:hypothetical protein